MLLMKKTKIYYPNQTFDSFKGLKKPFFLEVKLYNTVKEVQRYARDKTCAAMYRSNSVVIFPKWKVNPRLGRIYISREKMGVGLISHEVYHATMDYAYKKFRVRSVRTSNCERQEALAYFHGYMVKEICNWVNEVEKGMP